MEIEKKARHEEVDRAGLEASKKAESDKRRNSKQRRKP